jgi:UDPglucose 6-dehydrogenase
VIGAGYVGLVTAVGFAELGHNVNLLEIIPEKLKALQDGRIPIFEPGLEELWQRNQAKGRILVTDNYIEGMLGTEFAFIAVGTPSTRGNRPDLKWVQSAAQRIRETASGPLVVIIKSTVPVGTAKMVADILDKNGPSSLDLTIVSNPEFLREGAAVYDFFHPSRVVIGSTDDNAAAAVARLYQPLNSPMILCDNNTAEMSKYASNIFLATRISFMNEMALLCDRLGVDIVTLAKIMGLDPRFGDGYLNAGLGWGGSCLPKDVKGYLHMAKSSGVRMRLAQAVQEINQNQPQIVMEKLKNMLGSIEGKTIGILGLSFKPGSDDMREARSLLVISLLLQNGCSVKACDPVASNKVAKLLPEVACYADAYETARSCDALVLVTEWGEYKQLNFEKLASLMKQPVIIDGRNSLDPEKAVKAGFVYEGIGRGFRKAVSQELLTLSGTKTS